MSATQLLLHHRYRHNKLEVLQRHCEAVGRPYDAALGIEHAVVLVAGPWNEDAVARLAAAQRPGA